MRRRHARPAHDRHGSAARDARRQNIAAGREDVDHGTVVGVRCARIALVGGTDGAGAGF